MNDPSQETTRTLRIVATSTLVFVCYFIIGLQLAVAPIFVHWRLGFNPVVAGFAVSIQYAATLLSRPFAGRMGDTKGGKFTTTCGMVICAASGLVLFLSMGLQARPVLSLCALLLCRLVLGVGESCAATGATLWGIGRTGADHTAQVISWSGVASYGALAIGAPAGVWLEQFLGSASIGVVSAGIAVAGLLWSLGIRPSPVLPGKELAFGRVFAKVFPYGLSLALGGVGFGTIASFITLYYASLHWQNSAFALSAFGISFVATRLLFAKTIDRCGGYRVAMVSLAVEVLGLMLLWIAPVPALALAASAVSGIGFSLVFPALGVEAVRRFRPHNRGSALGAYTAFIDLSLGISGPLAGVIVVGWGYPPIFPFAAAMALSGLILAYVLYRHHSGNRLDDALDSDLCDPHATTAEAAPSNLNPFADLPSNND
jgi:MFS family permease